MRGLCMTRRMEMWTLLQVPDNWQILSKSTSQPAQSMSRNDNSSFLDLSSTFSLILSFIPGVSIPVSNS